MTVSGATVVFYTGKLYLCAFVSEVNNGTRQHDKIEQDSCRKHTAIQYTAIIGIGQYCGQRKVTQVWNGLGVN